MKNYATRKMTTGMLFVIMVLSIFFSTGAFAAEAETGDATAIDRAVQTDLAKTAPEIGVEYRAHIQNEGDMPQGEDNFIAGPEPIGTRGLGLRVEGFMISLTGAVPEGANIVYQVHAQNEGWMTAVEDGAFAGTRGESQRVEAIRISLENLPGYDVYYRGHVQNIGDVPQVSGDWGWVKNGEELGTTGLSLRLEELEVKIVKRADIAYDEAGTFGPKTGLEVINDNVTINETGVVLQNMHIKGNLTMGPGVSEGAVTLNNITVDVSTYVKGSGENSIHINGGSYAGIIVQQASDGQTRIAAIGADGLAVVITEAAKGQNIIIEGAFDRVIIDAPDVKLSTRGDTKIREFNVAEGATDSQVTLDSQTTVEKLVLDEKTAIKGQGTVREADVNKDGVTFDKAPDQQVVEPGVTPPVVTPPSPSPGGGGPSYTPLSSISAIVGVPQVGVALSAGTIAPNTATVTYQWLISDKADGTYTGIAGATSSTYTPVAGDAGSFIKLKATGVGGYSGTVTSAATGVIEAPVAAPTTVEIAGAESVEVMLNGEATSPYTATVKDQYGAVMKDETVTWTLKAPVADVSIAADTGVVTIKDTTEAEDFTVMATSTTDATKSAEKTVTLTQELSSDATLNKESSTVKGELVEYLGTPDADLTKVTPGKAEITPDQAENTSNSEDFITSFVPTDTTAKVKAVKYPENTSDFSDFETAAEYNNNEVIIDGDIFIIQVMAEDKSIRYYAIFVHVANIK